MNGIKKLEKWFNGSIKNLNMNPIKNNEFEISYCQIFDNNIKNYFLNINDSFKFFEKRILYHSYNFCLVIEIFNYSNEVELKNAINSLNFEVCDFLNSSFYLFDKDYKDNIIKNGNLIESISWLNISHKVFKISKFNSIFNEIYTHLYIVLE